MQCKSQDKSCAQSQAIRDYNESFQDWFFAYEHGKPTPCKAVSSHPSHLAMQFFGNSSDSQLRRWHRPALRWHRPALVFDGGVIRCGLESLAVRHRMPVAGLKGWCAQLPVLIAAFAMFALLAIAASADPPDYGKEIRPIFTKYCLGCHNAQESEGGLRMHSLAALRLGGETGKSVEAGSLEGSLLWQRIRGTVEPKMPPADMPQLTEGDIDSIGRWIADGAKGDDRDLPLEQRLPTSTSQRAFSGPSPITAAIQVPNTDLLLLGRHGGLDILQGQLRSQLELPIVGKVTQIRSSPDGRWLAVASGLPGIGGRVLVIDAASVSSTKGRPSVRRTINAHNDIITSAVISPNSQYLATAGYDRAIHLWDLASGDLVRSFLGHNGAVYDLDFDASGEVLASASADETVKIWSVATGQRLDTLGQPESEQYAVRFDPSGNKIIAVGADRRLRVWRLLSKDKPTVSPMEASIFAHEAPIVLMAISRDGNWIATAAEDRTIKRWHTGDWQTTGLIDKLDDVATSLQWSADGNTLWTTSLAGDIRSIPVPRMRKENDSPLPHSESADREKASIPFEETATVLESKNGPRQPSTAQHLLLPCSVVGVLAPEDVGSSSLDTDGVAGDWYAFDAQAGQEWIVSIDAAKSGSPLDSAIDITDAVGKPLLRTRLQAVRESYFTFRGKDSSNVDDFRLHRWEDMELNQWLYAGGEVVKLWLYPRGPDSGFKVYPGSGNRQTFYGTSASTHALNEPAWVVRELKSDEDPLSNGLPIFPVYYSNDDDPGRRLGKDSLIHFTAPADGRYLVRVRDARGQSGENYQYTLSIAQPNPRIVFRAEQSEMTLRPGVGSEFSVLVDRIDGMDGRIDVTVEGLPEGVQLAQPLYIESNQIRAIGQIFASKEILEKLPDELEWTLVAKASWDGREILSDPVRMKIKRNLKSTLIPKIVGRDDPSDAQPIHVLRIRPGQTISAKLVIERGENLGDIAFGGDDCGRNLPHGCLVSNIGLNGLLIPADQSSREVFITAAPTVLPQQRLFHLRAQVDGNPTTSPVLLIVE